MAKNPEALIREKIRKILLEDATRADLYHKRLEEKEKQDATSSNLFGGGDSDDSTDVSTTPSDTDGAEHPSKDEEPSKTVSDETDALRQGDVNVEDVIERLNAIRSGRSLKDESLKKQMDQYVQSLKSPERVALLAFLKGISQIVTGEVSGESAVEPEQDPANVSMSKTGIEASKSPEKTRSVKPNVIKTQQPKGGIKNTGGEDTSAPAPIVPKKR